MSSSAITDFAASANENEEGISKNVLKTLIIDNGMEPGINTALFIASGALGRKKTWTGTDYGEHWLRVAGVGYGELIGDEEKIIGILHDVVEDSDWEIEDLEEIGFSPLICEGVRSVTKMDGEKYLDASKRASINPLGRRVKMRDNKDNMDLTRSTFAATDKQKYLYHISYSYLNAVEKNDIPPNYSVWSFLRLEKFAGLVSRDNIDVISRATLEPVPVDFATKFRSGTIANDLKPA
jgi:hypothetical protein